MSAPVVVRQITTLCRIVADHVVHDPVFFGLQVFRRLPARASRVAGALLSPWPGAAAAAASNWLRGDLQRAEEYTAARTASRLQSRVLGELSLAMGSTEAAAQHARRLSGSRGGKMLDARILWHGGHMSDAVDAAPTSRSRERLASEATLFTSGWEPSVSALGAAPTPKRVPRADVLFAVTNSLPHTQSGYTYRTHAVLKSVKDTGMAVVAVDRAGYPTDVGRFTLKDRADVGEVPYLFDIPSRLARTPAARLEQHADFLSRTVRASGARILHTTTHFTNGVVARAVAREVGIPWVYEVRGSLEDTWASSRGDADAVRAARNSERFRLFRQREIEIASEADAVITLGETMAEELAARGLDRDRIMIAPNSVSDDLLDVEWDLETSTARARMGLPEGGVWVGTAASIVGYEGLDDLIDAVALARSAGTDLRVLIVGDGVELPGLKERATALGAAAVFTGRVPQTRAHQYIVGMDIFAVPRKDVDVSRKITPLKPVEAGGLGRAVVLSGLPALTESLPAGARRVFEAENVEDLARSLASLADNAEERRVLGSAARRYVEDHRTWASVAERYRRMYEGLGVQVNGRHG